MDPTEDSSHRKRPRGKSLAALQRDHARQERHTQDSPDVEPMEQEAEAPPEQKEGNGESSGYVAPRSLCLMFLTYHYQDETAVAKMKDILASQFDIEIEYKTQKIQEAVEAIQKVEAVWYELQALWSQQSYIDELEGCSPLLVLTLQLKKWLLNPVSQAVARRSVIAGVSKSEICTSVDQMDNMFSSYALSVNVEISPPSLDSLITVVLCTG